MARVFPILILMLLAGCSGKQPDFSQAAEEFAYSSLAMSPVSATSSGYHQHQGVPLDELLDDYSEQGLNHQRSFYRGFEQRLKSLPTDRLSPQDRADYDLILNQIQLALLELDGIQSYRHNPTLYVELVGNALFGPYSLEYAPKPLRFRHLIARLDKLPALVQQARENLVDSPEIWNTVAREENEGNIGLVDQTLREAVPPEMKADYAKAAAAALDALRGFSDFLKNDLSQRASDWRLGKVRYEKKFRCALGTDQSPEQVLTAAEEALTSVRRQIGEVVLPLHHKLFPTHRDPVDLNLIAGETLAKIARKHATPDTYFPDARRDLDEARQFVKAKGLLPLPPRDNLQVIETPPFMRGIYSVGGFNPAPVLEPQLGAYYWLTPIPKTWPKDRTESKLREYNFYGLKLLTIHEAMPGHYVQAEYANSVQPKTRRALRSLFGNGAYVEGWAVYVSETMLDEGYLNGSVELRLTFLKHQLRMIANTILDVRLQTMGMTDEQAMDLMLKKAFQEKEEAEGKLRRAKLSSAQLPTYFVGWRDWHRLRDLYRKEKGAAFSLPKFHEETLKEGSLPLPTLARLLTGKALP